MAEATLLIGSKNYSSWSLRGWLIARMSGLPFEERSIPLEDASSREELLLRSSSILVPCLIHDGIEIWDTLAIAEYLNELCPEAGMFPADRFARARCRSISGEMHSGFSALRSSLPMNLRSRRPEFQVWSSAQADIDRVCTIWRNCLETWGGPFLLGSRYSVADAMYAPVCTRFQTYHVKLDEVCAAYGAHILALPEMVEWTRAAMEEEGEVPELEF
jgi:glutathione S-transferase